MSSLDAFKPLNSSNGVKMSSDGVEDDINKIILEMDGMVQGSHNPRSDYSQASATPEMAHQVKPEKAKEANDDADLSDDDFDEVDDVVVDASHHGFVTRAVMWLQRGCHDVYSFLLRVTKGYFFNMAFLFLFIAYFIAAMVYKSTDEGAHRLLGCTIAGVFITSRHWLLRLLKRLWLKLYGSDHLTSQHQGIVQKSRFFLRWIMYGVMVAVVVWSMIEEGRDNTTNLRSIPGLMIFLIFSYLVSVRPDKIQWHTIFWSNGLQFLCALFAIKWKYGREIILWIQDRFNEYFANTHAGSSLLFGESWRDHYLIFGAIPLMFYASATITVLYYLGAMQFIINVLGNILKFSLNTSRIECTTVAAGIFMEGGVTILMIRPFLYSLTRSQLFAVLTSCFSSLGGAYMAVLYSFGISLEFVIPAMLVSAPATFAVCKLMYPETKKRLKSDELEADVVAEEKLRYSSIMEAAQAGAMVMFDVFSNLVIVSYIFFSVVSWINNTLRWLGERVGNDRISIEYIGSYVLYPLALAMGVEEEDCRRVAMLLGYRIGIYNIFAFLKLAEMKLNRFTYLQYMVATNGTGPVLHDNDDIILGAWNKTLKLGFINERSEAIITYCLCGFSSCLSIVQGMAILGGLIPKRRAWLAKMAIPLLIAGNIANCMTGCFAILLMLTCKVASALISPSYIDFRFSSMRQEISDSWYSNLQ